jgi:ubiquinone/menaquinone biosynthesis C-methylase UbiE
MSGLAGLRGVRLRPEVPRAIAWPVDPDGLPADDALDMPNDADAGVGDYVFDRTRTDEEKRLEAQSTIVDPFTERLFRDAGLGDGMRLLELGSGAGDVSMLAARIVGSQGRVVGIEGSPVAIKAARRRVDAAGLTNVSFLVGDLRDLDAVIDQSVPPFDAVIGRMVLQFMPDPAAVLGAAASRMRPGGLVCFQECVHQTYAYPSTPLWDQVRSWVLAALDHSGVETQMGLRLFQTFLAAGLPAPELRLEAGIGGGERAPAFMWADLVRSIIPTLEQAGIATEAEIDPSTLVDRLMKETTAAEGVVITIALVGAWSRTPS